VVLSVQSATAAASLCNITAARKGVFYGVHPKVVSGELKPEPSLELSSEVGSPRESKSEKGGHGQNSTVLRRWVGSAVQEPQGHGN
jgi:hypothetical protein